MPQQGYAQGGGQQGMLSAPPQGPGNVGYVQGGGQQATPIPATRNPKPLDALSLRCDVLFSYERTLNPNPKP